MGVFFDSILGTLNHIYVGDVIWLKRFATIREEFPSLIALDDIPQPKSLDAIPFTELEQLWEARDALDKTIVRFCSELTEGKANLLLTYKNMNGVATTRALGDLVTHLFNHQTHHRGQVTALLHQQGVDVGTTDLLVRIPVHEI